MTSTSSAVPALVMDAVMALLLADHDASARTVVLRDLVAA